jgi:hypothetical protein
MKGVLYILFILVFCQVSYSQDRVMDSIVNARKTELLPGKIPVSYTAGYKSRAQVLQQAFENAASFYEAKYHKQFKARLAVLDSVQWPATEIPYGVVAYYGGWAFIPANFSYNNFLRLYGIEGKEGKFREFLKDNHITGDNLISSVFFVFSLHELGHYFALDLNNEQVPDMFANEMIATYFSVNYLKSINSKALGQVILFSKFIRQNYNPEHHKIGDMDSLFNRMPVQNFKWYHCNIVLLCNEVYKKKSGAFIDDYLALFAKGAPNKYTTAEVVSVLNKHTSGVVQKWVDGLAAYKPPAN